MQDSPKKTAKELIAEGVAALTAQLEAGNSAALTAHLATIARFHNYSFGNIMAIARQMPDASRVAGFHTWKTFGRNVKKGEHAIRILAPMVGKPKDAAAGEDTGPRVFGFRSVCVFDVSQTEGAELPEFARATGDTGDTLAKLLRFAGEQSIAVGLGAELPGSALGMSYGGRVAVAAGQSDAEVVATLTHELAHELLHKGERRTSANRDTRELEAEAVAFIVGAAIGLDMAAASADYIKLYDGNAEALGESLEAISRASTLILKSLAVAAEEVAGE
jgi:hypothetical protein